MTREALTGSRIREKRIMAKLKQAELARQANISASYLNLIEHNRRRIGGKVLLSIAAALEVDPSDLTEGAEAQLLATLRAAADTSDLPEAELDRVEEFAGRFPGWAEILARQHGKITALERTVESLNDRLAHDPDLAAAMHEVLTTAAAIRSTSAILVEDQNLEATWRARFHSNIDADSRRLADSAKALAQYFEVEDDTDLISATPEDELDAFLEAAGDDLGQIAQGAAQIEAVVAASPALRSEAARALGRRYLMTYAADTQAIDPAEFRAALREIGPDPLALAARLAAPPARILRYLARQEALNAGIVVCNRAGQVLFRRRTREFDVPRFGALPSDWLLFEALAQPGLVMAEQHAPTESQGRALQVYATTELTSPASYNKAPDVEATMIVFPVS